MLRSATGEVIGTGERLVMRRTVVLLTVLVAMLLLASGVALAAVLKGTPGDDEISGTRYNDTIYGYGGDDALFGSPEGMVGSGADNINGGTGDDTMNGELGPDSLAADWGNDRLADGPVTDGMKDTLSGGPGNDQIVSNNYPRATDAIRCGTGYDTVTADSKDTFLDRGNCEKVVIYNPTSANDPKDPNYVAPCPSPPAPCPVDSRPRYR